MKHIVLIIILLLTFSNCQKQEKVPQLSDEQIIKVLVDLHIAEASSLSLGNELKDSVINLYYPQIFEIHGIEDSLFFKEFAVIRKNPKKLEMIYEKVLVEIEQLGSEKVEPKSPPKKK